MTINILSCNNSYYIHIFTHALRLCYDVNTLVSRGNLLFTMWVGNNQFNPLLPKFSLQNRKCENFYGLCELWAIRVDPIH